MFHKRAEQKQTIIQPLNKPNFSNSFIKDQNLIIDDNVVQDIIQKTAATASKDKTGDGSESPAFDLQAEIDSHPDSLFVKCFAIKADEPNDNGDFFSKDELIKGTPTFVGVPLFTNHANSDINQARGKVVHSWWDEEKNGIMIIGRVDAVAYPQLARGIKEDYILGTSMGCVTPECRVLMQDMAYLPISEVKPGDFVYTHKGRVKKVLNTQIRYKKEFIRHIQIENSVIKITTNHPILTLKKNRTWKSNKKQLIFTNEDKNVSWVDAKDLQKNSSIIFFAKNIEELETCFAYKSNEQNHVFVKNVYTKNEKTNIKNSHNTSSDFIVRKIKSNLPVFYDGLVYNLQVEEDNSYICENMIIKNCQVQYSLCSICHSYAETPDSYCQHIREQKTRQVTARNQKCEYHKNGKEQKCPICGSTKSDIKTFSVNSKSFEYNYGIKFIENSFVTHPACSDCGVTEVIDPNKLRTKIAEIEKTLPRLLKAIKTHEGICTDKQCIKVAGQQEIDQLTQALDLISSVSKAMLNQKEQIDLEFLSDLVQVLADLQTVTDELTEQGYGRLQSPDPNAQPQQPQQSPETQKVESGPQITNSAQPVNPTPGGGSKVHSGPAGQVGNVTSPLATTKKLNLEKVANSILCNIKALTLSEKEIIKKEHRKQLKTASLKKKSNLHIDFSINKKELKLLTAKNKGKTTL